LISGKIGVYETAMVAIYGARESGPRIEDHEIAGSFALDDVALGIDDRRLHAEERQRRRARLELDRAGQGRDEDAARLGLPPGIDDRAAPLSHHVVVPLPRFGIDRLPDGAKELQRFPLGALNIIVARTHQRPDRGRHRVEDIDLVLVYHLPEARGVGIARYALEDEGGRAVGARPIDYVGVAGDPADICRAPIDIAIVIVEHVLVGYRREHEISARRVHHALRLSGRA